MNAGVISNFGLQQQESKLKGNLSGNGPLNGPTNQDEYLGKDTDPLLPSRSKDSSLHKNATDSAVGAASASPSTAGSQRARYVII